MRGVYKCKMADIKSPCLQDENQTAWVRTRSHMAMLPATPYVLAVESSSVVRYTECCSETAPVLKKYLSFISPVRLILSHWIQGSFAIAFTDTSILPLVKSLNMKCVELPHLQQSKWDLKALSTFSTLCTSNF